MADAAARVGEAVGKQALSSAKKAFLELHKDHYNLEALETALFETLDRLEKKLDKLLNRDYKAAVLVMRDWVESDEPPDRPVQLRRLRQQPLDRRQPRLVARPRGKEKH